MTEFAPGAADVNHLSPPFESERGLFLGRREGSRSQPEARASDRWRQNIPQFNPTTVRRRDRGGRSHGRWIVIQRELLASPTAQLHVGQFTVVRRKQSHPDFKGGFCSF
jgi:hypothetical protein